MILVTVLDGLRPDYVSAETTPFLFEMSRRGISCSQSHAVFPTATRINSASLTTGCYPGKHGIVDNELYIPSIDPHATTSCANWEALSHMAQQEGRRLLDVPTLGELLRQGGRSMVSAGSGSPGTTYLMNPEVAGPVVNWAVAWPDSLMDVIAKQHGGMLGEESDTGQRHRFVLDILREELIPRHDPDLVTLWLTEPDHAQHEHGIGSPQALDALREVDDLLEGLRQWLAMRYDDVTCFVLSDHGFSTVAPRVDPVAEFIDAGLKDSLDSDEVILSCNSIYLREQAIDRLDQTLEFLASRDWIGAMLLRDDLSASSDWPVYQSAAFGNHRRSPEILFSYAWSDAPNAYGAPGSVAQSTDMAAVHGASSPYDTNNTLLAWGAGLRKGKRSALPCGIIDVAPTVLHLLGIEPPAEMDGRILFELLRDGASSPVEDAHNRIERIPLSAGSNRVCQEISYTALAGTTYLNHARLIHKTEIG